MKLLAIDTATELCSAALRLESEIISREAQIGRGHAEHILPMVDALLGEAGVSLSDIDGIAFGRGPGGFTGVRLAASIAQGLAFGAQLPAIPISDLSATAQRAFDLDDQLDRVLVCNDARMQEVYWACFDRGSNGLALLVGSEHVGPATGVQLPAAWMAPIAGAGRGFRIHRDLGSRVSRVFDDLLPRASEIARLAVDAPRVRPEDAIPVYLRDDVARPSS